MSSLYADITGVGSETAAKMAVEDFGGSVLGRPIQIIEADHKNRTDLGLRDRPVTSPTTSGVGVAIADVTNSAIALAACRTWRSAEEEISR